MTDNALRCFIITVLFFLAGCSNNTDNKIQQTTTLIVQPTSSSTHLYYNATINPLHITSVTSPADGTITQLYFKYGENITKAQPLVQLDSDKLETAYQTDLTAYLRAKDKLSSAKQDYQTNQEMWALQIIPRNKLELSKSTLDAADLELMQAEFKLNKDIGLLGIDKQVVQLDLDDTNAVRNAMFGQQWNHIIIHAPTEGIALFPTKSNDDITIQSGGTPLQVGDQVKESQPLVSIGDLTGLTLTIPVSEIDIDSIQLGQDAIITGVAFPNISLHGTVTSIDAQAKNLAGSSSGLATFPVEITVDHLTPEQQQLIHTGMSANVTLTINHPPHIMLPINAVFQKNNQTNVKVKSPNNGKIITVPVTTGQTTQTQVTILTGLKAGDAVVIPMISSTNNN